MSRKLNDRQARFVEEYLVDLNATQAAIRAGYSERTAHVTGPRLLGNVRVAAEIQRAQNERSERTEVTADRVLQELARIAFADLKNYVDYRTELIKVGETEGGEPIFDYHPVVEAKPAAEVDGAPISEVSLSQRGVLSFKLHDKMRALEKLGDHLGMFKQVHEHTGPDGGPIETKRSIDLSTLTDKELEALEGIIVKVADSGTG